MKKRANRTRRPRRLEVLETKTLLAGDLMRMHNPLDGADVNNDGNVTMIDALMTVQEVRRGGRGDGGGNQFPDVNDDGTVTLGDALEVVNRLRRPRPGGGGDGSDGNPEEGQPRPPRPPAEPAPIDGVGNNLSNPEWGSTDEQFLRLTTVEYGDGISTPGGEDRVSAREISNAIFDQEGDIFNDRGLTAITWQWGQFLDHDITLTHSGGDDFPIDVPAGDIYFDPTGAGDVTIGLTRSVTDPTTGDSVDNPAQQVNSITAFIDGSMIYGSDAETAASLREGTGGRLATSEGDLLPINELSGFFEAGDIRANEQPGLTAMHTLFVREHNHHADRIAAQNPDWTDDQIFEAARRIVIAEIQSITYNEFIPTMLGRRLPEYQGYNEEVNPGISNIFATAAYRFGHSMISSNYDLVDNDGNVIESLSLAESFFNPSIITENGIDSALKGLIVQQSQEIDTNVVGELRNFLFGPPGSGGLDLTALNIQRGRDHGLADYNQTRVDMGLEAVESFADITSDPELQSQLASVYDSVDDIDVWVGILAEDHLPGSSMGELGTRVMVDQFMRLRDGDRFYYENTLSPEQIDRVEATSLGDIIERNTDLEDLPRNVWRDRDALPDGGDRPQRPRDGGRQDGPTDGPLDGPVDDVIINENELPGRPPRPGDRPPPPGDDEAPAEENDSDVPNAEETPTDQQRPEGRPRPGGRPPRPGDNNDDNPLPPGGVDPNAADAIFAQIG